jgi:hypothetical protein
MALRLRYTYVFWFVGIGTLSNELVVFHRDVGMSRLRREPERRSPEEKGDKSMSSQITGLRVASIVFGLLAIAQLARLMIRPEALVAGYPVPLWPSALAFIILGSLSIWMWRLSRKAIR